MTAAATEPPLGMSLLADPQALLKSPRHNSRGFVNSEKLCLSWMHDRSALCIGKDDIASMMIIGVR